ADTCIVTQLLLRILGGVLVLDFIHMQDFFFQAEDGIRDFHVNGVQTCALPISEVLRIVDAIHRDKKIDKEIVFQAIESALVSASRKYHSEDAEVVINIDRKDGTISGHIDGVPKIGRASCRERGESCGGGSVRRG